MTKLSFLLSLSLSLSGVQHKAVNSYPQLEHLTWPERLNHGLRFSRTAWTGLFASCLSLPLWFWLHTEEFWLTLLQILDFHLIGLLVSLDYKTLSRYEYGTPEYIQARSQVILLHLNRHASLFLKFFSVILFSFTDTPKDCQQNFEAMQCQRWCIHQGWPASCINGYPILQFFLVIFSKIYNP